MTSGGYKYRFVATCEKRIIISPWKGALDSGFHAVDFRFQIPGTGFQNVFVSGIQIVNGIADSLSSMSDSTSKNFPDFKFPYMGR